MANPISTVGPVSYTPNGSGTRFYPGAISVMIRRVAEVIRWAIRAVLGHKMYFSSLTAISTLSVLSWTFGIPDYSFSILDIVPSAACRESNENLIRNTSSLQLANSATATTLMTLLPALLIFAPFPTAQITSLISFSTPTAIITSAFTLGLATARVSTQPKNRIFRVTDLCTDATIRVYARVMDPRRALHHLYLPGAVASHIPTDNDLVPEFQRSIAEAFFQAKSSNPLRDIMLKAVFDSNRASRLQLSVMEVGFFLIQTGLLYLLDIVVPYLADIDIFWLCSGQTPIAIASWIGIMAVLAGIFGTFTASTQISKDEILHLRPLSPSYVPQDSEKCPSANDSLATLVTRLAATPNPSCWDTISTIGNCIHDDWAFFTVLARRMMAVQHISHGMVVVLRHSDVGGAPVRSTKAHFYGMLCGFFQALVLILMTAIFGSTYNGDMLLGAMFLIAFLALIVISRAYSVYFCRWMERAFDHIVIEYDTAAQLNAIRTIIAGMPSVSVHNITTGRTYRAGNLVDADCATWHSRINTSRRRRVQIVTTVLAGGAAAVFMVLIHLSLMVIFGIYFAHVNTMVFYIIVILFVVGLVAGKVASDFEFINTHWGSMEIGLEVTSPV